MSTSTPIYGFVKPLASESYDVAIPNANSDKAEAALLAKASNAELAELLQGARNINLVNGGELRWGMVANTFSWSKIMSIYPAGGKLLRGGVAIKSINIAVGTAVLANANDCMYITIPATDAATAVVGVAQFSAITGTDKLIIAIRDSDSCLELLGGGWVTYNTLVEAGGKRDAYIPRSLVTAANDFLVASGAGVVVKKTFAETKTILGINTATEVLAGVVELATPAEVITGTDTTRAVTCAGVKIVGDTKVPIVGTLVQNQSLDTMVTAGRFRAYNMLNTPIGIKASDNDAYLDVYRPDGTEPPWVRQVWRDIRTARIFERSSQAGTFGQWMDVLNRTVEAVTYYVRTDGNNANTGRDNTAAGAFRTIQAAIDVIPQIVNHDIIIQIGDGAFNEAVSLSGHVGAGSIVLRGNASNYAAVGFLGLVIMRNSCMVNISDFTLTKTDWFALYVDNNAHVYSSKLRFVAASTYDAIYITSGGTIHVAAAEISNRDVCITSAYGSTVISENCTGINNKVVLRALGATIFKNGTQPAGVTAEAAVWGGQIR